MRARNTEDEEFGLTRLIEICTTKHHDVDGLLTAVMDAVQAWSSELEQGDDITLVGLAASDG